MARKKFEFRPDYDGVDLWNKLYITQKQRKSLLKWTVYAVVCVFALILQDSMLAKFRIMGAVIDLAPCAMLLICVLAGAEKGGIFTLCASVFFVLSGTAPGAYCVALLTLSGVLAALLREHFLRRSFSSTWLCAGAACVAYEMSVFAMGVFYGETYQGRWGVFFLTGLLGAAMIPLLCPLMERIGRIGGETWKE